MPGPSVVRTYIGAESRSAITSCVVNLDVTPTAGNVLVTWCAWDKSVGTWTAPSGFTTIASVVGASTSGALAYKVSDGTETSVTWTGTTAGSGQIAWLAEFTPCHVGSSTSPTYSDTVVTSVSTGTAASDTGLALAFLTTDTSTNTDGSPTWSNGFTGFGAADYATDAGGSIGSLSYSTGTWFIGGDPMLGAAYKVITAEAAETTYSCTDTGDQMWACLVVLRADALTRTAGDTVTVSDAATRQATLSRSASDSVTASDAASRLLTLLRSAADSVALSDAATGIRVIIRTAADAVGISDAATRTLTLARTATQTVTITDAATRLLTLVRSATQTVTASDAATRVLALIRSAAQAVGIADSASASITPAGTATGIGPGPIARVRTFLASAATAGSDRPDAAASTDTPDA